MRILAMMAAMLMAGSMARAAAIDDAAFQELLANLEQLQERGELLEADALARKTLNENAADLTADQTRDLEFEVERVRRIRQDYTVTESKLIDSIRDRIPDLTDEEFKAWEKEGRFDVREFDGAKYYVNSSRANLFWRHPELKKRNPKNKPGTEHTFLWNCYQEAIKEMQGTASGTGKPAEMKLTMSIAVEGGVAPEGQTIRCWMPYPQQFAVQSGVRLLDSSSTPAWINAPAYPMRSIYFEQPSKGGAPTEFRAVYTLAASPRRYQVDPEVVVPSTPEACADCEWFVREQPPHIVFNEEFRKLAAEIGGDEKNPYLRARKYYDWMCHNVVYSYAREYSTLRNISDYVRTNKYGDCGQLTLMFMTLCRLSDIPARWQSGWVLYPMNTNLHDWCEIYIAPYGWIPVDVNYGIMFEPEDGELTAEQRRELQDYYFGGLDAYRMIANRDHGYPHYPAKPSFRSDTVDFQRGELESGGRNIYFDQFNYNMDVEYVTPLPSAPEGDQSAGRPQGSNLAR